MKCYHAHPRFPDQTCGAKLFEGWIKDGQIVIRCWRCHKPVTVDGQVDNKPVATYRVAK